MPAGCRGRVLCRQIEDALSSVPGHELHVHRECEVGAVAGRAGALRTNPAVAVPGLSGAAEHEWRQVGCSRVIEQQKGVRRDVIAEIARVTPVQIVVDQHGRRDEIGLAVGVSKRELERERKPATSRGRHRDDTRGSCRPAGNMPDALLHPSRIAARHITCGLIDHLVAGKCRAEGDLEREREHISRSGR